MSPSQVYKFEKRPDTSTRYVRVRSPAGARFVEFDFAIGPIYLIRT